MLVPCVAPAQAGARTQAHVATHYVIDRWTTDAGLPESSVNAIMQSRDGYLWIGTYGGVVRFDGTAFVPPSARVRAAIPSPRVTTLAQDASGGVWVGTEAGLAHVVGDDSATSLGARDGLPAGTPVALVTVDDTLWMLSSAGGLARIRDGHVAILIPPNGVLGDYGFGMVPAAHGRLWVHARRGAFLVDRGTGSVTPVRAIRGDPVTGVAFLEPDSAMWIGTQHGFARVTDADTQVVSFRGTPLLGVGIASVDRTADGALWLAAGVSGLWRQPALSKPGVPRARGDTLRRITQPAAGDEILRVLVDHEGNVWAGSRIGGLYRVRPALFTMYTTANGLAGDVEAGVLADHKGRVWVGSNCGGLSVINGASVHTYTTPDGVENSCIWSLAEGHDGSIWFGSYGGGLGHVVDGTVHWFTTADGLPDDAVLSLFVDRAGTLWIGTAQGLTSYQQGRFVTLDTVQGLVQNEVRTIYQARDGALWLGTLGGVSRLQDGHFTNYTSANGLPSAYVRAIYEDSSGTFWFGTYGGGLVRFRHDSVRVFSTDDGLFDDVISSLVEDAHGNLWMSSNRGVSFVALRALDAYARGTLPRIFATAYGTADGMISAETNGGFEPSVARTPDGRLWYPTVAGVAVIDPAAAVVNPVPPAVHIDAVAVNGRPMRSDSALVVGPGAPDIEISYSGISFSQPNAVIFRYRLDAWDPQWVEAGTRRTAYYSRLAPGSYRFMVTAANRDGVWSDSSTAMAFRVLAPVWERWWFRVLVLSILVIVVLGAIRARLARLRRAHLQQQEFSRQLIAREEAERKRVAGELHDSLGQDLLVVKNRALLALGVLPADDAARDQVTHISEVATEAIANVRRIAQNLRPYQIDRLGLTTALRAGIESVAESSGLIFDVFVDDINGLLTTEAEINLFRVVQETLNNVVKHAQASHVRVRVERDGNTLYLQVVDDGRGFEQQRGSQAPLKPGGLGLSGIFERTQIMGGTSTVESAPGAGTRVRVTVPLSVEALDSAAWRGQPAAR